MVRQQVLKNLFQLHSEEPIKEEVQLEISECTRENDQEKNVLMDNEEQQRQRELVRFKTCLDTNGFGDSM